nr:unnamed protein product [Callosobruchus analis]
MELFCLFYSFYRRFCLLRARHTLFRILICNSLYIQFWTRPLRSVIPFQTNLDFQRANFRLLYRLDSDPRTAGSLRRTSWRVCLFILGLWTVLFSRWQYGLYSQLRSLSNDDT